MQLDILSGLNPDLYPSHSHHQEEIADYFGQSLFRQLNTAEKERLAALDVFFIAFTNRCGSTLLAELLNQSGLGIPPRSETFNGDLVVATCEAHSIKSFTDYFLRVVDGWSNQHRVGFKIGPRQLFWLTRSGFLSQFKAVKIINCRRQDRVAQAVSYYLAEQTGRWHSQMGQGGNAERIPYSREGILGCLQTIHQSQQLINYYADIHNTPIISVDYEDILQQADRQIQRIAEFLGFAPCAVAPVNLDDVTIRQQRNAHNQSLVDQFRQEFSK